MSVISYLAFGLLSVTATASFAATGNVVHAFNTLPHGALPQSALVADAAGNLYGTTPYGGAFGVVFKLTLSKSGAWTQTVIHDFTGSRNGPDGAYPSEALTFDKAGNLYGSTAEGGVFGFGTVFRLTPTANSWKETIVHSFAGVSADGARPQGVVVDKAGNVYGSTAEGGNGPCWDYQNVLIGCGVVYRLSPRPDGTWAEDILYNFTGISNDAAPYGALVFDRAGNLYGVTTDGNQNQGEIFEMTPSATPGASWIETVLINLQGENVVYPNGSLVLDKAGNLYGTSWWGGVLCSTNNYPCGLVFELLRPTISGRSWTLAVLHNFQTGEGSTPFAGMVIDGAGNLYGTTSQGGDTSGTCVMWPYAGCGTIFELSPNQSGWALSTLYEFTRGSDGANPYGPLLRDSAGNLYATATTGGVASCTSNYSSLPGCGSVVKLAPVSGRTWITSVIYDFPFVVDGIKPDAGLVADSMGNFYGTTSSGGVNNTGAVFKLVRTSNRAWHTNLLYSFGTLASRDGTSPTGGLIFDSVGNLYGTTQTGGNFSSTCVSYTCGTIFKLSPASDGSWTETILYKFLSQSTTDGFNPSAALVFDDAGNLYGTTTSGGTYSGGTVFKLTPSSTGPWTESVLHNFGSIGDGANLFGTLIFDKHGNLYGTTRIGGASYGGRVFELSPPANSTGPWAETVLHDFTGGNDGNSPVANLIFDDEGSLYGTGKMGGPYNAGVVFKLTQSGGTWTETVLHNFVGGNGDGGFPVSGLIFDSAGNLYGTSLGGGIYSGDCYFGCGILFRLTESSQGQWQERVLHRFTGGIEGSQPVAPLLRDSLGNLYGTTSSDGAGAGGSVFEIRP
jgi:uncharacterized repeat protein (TIGR03803 family)